MNLKHTLIILALSTLVATASVQTREGWAGRLEQKSFDQHGRKVKRMVTVNGGIRSSMDRFSQASYYPPDPNGMDPLPTDTYAEGIMLIWGRCPESRAGYRWKVTFAGETTIDLIPAERILMYPIGVSYFSGLMVTEDGRNKTIGGFAYEVENRGAMTLSATVTADWEANGLLMAHRTTHGGTVASGALRVFAVVPERDEWALASGVDAEVK